MRILLVDDEEYSLMELQYSIDWNRYGFSEVITTTDPFKAWDCLVTCHIDAAFIDIRMPGLSGLEILARAGRENLDTCFIVISGFSDFSYAQEALRQDAVGYCLKPLDPDEVDLVMHKLINRICQKHTLTDPAYYSRLMTDTVLCQSFLDDVRRQDPECSTLTLLQISSSDIQNSVLKMKKLFQTDFRFLLPDADIIAAVFPAAVPADLLESLGSADEDAALITAVYSPCTVSSFCNAVKRLEKEFGIHSSRRENGFYLLPAASEEMSGYITEIMHYIDTHYSEKISLKKLAGQYYVNYTYLSQVFRKVTGKSVSDYVTQIRLANACKLLTETETPITVIAECVGFHDYHYFCNQFKSVYGVTPRQYRSDSRKSS